MTSSRKHQPAPTDASCPIRPLIGYAAPARATRRFTQGAASVTLRADRGELIRDAETTLYSYARTRTAASRWTITLHTGVPVDQAGATALFADTDDHDIGPNLQAQSIGMPGGRAFWIREHATLVHLDHLLGTITVHASDLDAARFFAARLVRQAMTAQLLEHDAVYAHAAALVHAGHGLLIAGPKGAGKTTTLLSALRLVGGDFVTNDRLLLHCDPDGGTVGHAWPMHLRATASTLHAVPGMSRFLSAEQQQNGLAGQAALSGKIAIEPDELRATLPDMRIVGEVRPTLMLWPYRSASDLPPEPVPAAEVRDVLVRTQFFMHEPVTSTTSHRNHWLLPPDQDRTALSLTAVADQLARTVPCVRIPVTDSPAALAARVVALLDHAATQAARPGGWG
ncbi:MULTISPECIES: hypothetical protein [Pseudonocardiaceae]|uniref:HPr kinase n=3 Tax=Pseudonocardiaceae TaxID=2070 RepID=F4CWR1_PSEUX|nr:MULTISPECIES: hypothetical protein [Pseudonocardiaceae]AEA23494.1 hypothetical protein Psed_1249 [Pseudonocardia dioxanivorans CB1190]MBB5891882.1 hypothetical protein [Kutzneria kofuensis]SFQ20347.1 hypothetical protein SAMN05421854_109283 [Amycolatopsis rubida]